MRSLSERIDAQFNPWRLEFWYVSGVHTGWRIVKGHGFNMETHSVYAFDWQKSGDYEAKEGEANRVFGVLIDGR